MKTKLCLAFSGILLSLNLSYVLCANTTANQPSPTIRQTTNGPVEGIKQKSSLRKEYYAFKGIPFAEPPITGKDPHTGIHVDRRFKAPVPLKRKWDHLKVQHMEPSCIPSALQPSAPPGGSLGGPPGGPPSGPTPSGKPSSGKSPVSPPANKNSSRPKAPSNRFRSQPKPSKHSYKLSSPKNQSSNATPNTKSGAPSQSGKPPGGSPPNEDCLYLNVYVPAGGSEHKTVLVWIYGGVFNMGDANEMTYGPDFLLSLDNIVVTLNYRTGIFGFLNMGFGEYTGNMGLKDQQLALKWVHENIEQFSGNKSEVLIFGESAGGASVSFQILNKQSRKYFNRALAISSSAFSYYALSERNKLKELQDCFKIQDKNQMVKYLQTAKSEDIVKCRPYQIGNDRSVTWVPTVEHASIRGAFLTKTPEEVYDSRDPPILDAMFSFNSKEYASFRPDLLNSKEPLIPKNVSQTNPDVVQLPFRGFTQKAHPHLYVKALRVLRKAYFPHPNNATAVAEGNVQLMSDLTFSESVLRNAVHQTIANNRGKKRNTFIYRFSVDSEFLLIPHMSKNKFNGAGHGDDVCYVFHCHITDPAYQNHLAKKDDSYKKIMRSVQLITNFARTGNPSIDGDTPFINCRSDKHMFAQDVGNNLKTSVISNIKTLEHYDAWREVEAIYNWRDN